MSDQNLVSMVISEEDEAFVLEAIERIESRLNGLVFLGEDRRKVRMMGPKSEVPSRTVIRALQQNPAMVPPSLDVAGAIADLDALERIVRIDERLQRLALLVHDTRAALGSDIYGVARKGY